MSLPWAVIAEKNRTVPVRPGAPEWVELTCAVRVTLAPWVIAAFEVVTDVVVGKTSTVCSRLSLELA